MKRTRGLRARSFRREYKTNIRRSRKLVVWKYYFLKRLTARIPSPRRRRAPPARAQAPAYSGPRPVPAPRHYLACRIPPSRSRGAPRACLRRPTRPPHSTQPTHNSTQSPQRAQPVRASRYALLAAYDIARSTSEVKCQWMRFIFVKCVCIEQLWICLFMVSTAPWSTAPRKVDARAFTMRPLSFHTHSSNSAHPRRPRRGR